MHGHARRTYLGWASFIGVIAAAAACSSGDAAPGTSNDTTPDSGTPTPTTDSGSGGGTDTGGGNPGTDSGSSGTPSVCDGAGTKVLAAADAFIDDFEEAAILPGWSSFNDVQPTPNAIKITQVAGGAVSTGHSGKYSGTGAKIATAGGYGVGTVFNEAIDPGAGILCVDITAFDGVSFWAKAGTDGAKISVNFVVPATNMAGTDDQGRVNGGDCKTKCFNHPHVALTLTPNWAQYTVKFADAAGGSAKVGSVIQELAWLSPDADWDFSIDEITFYKGSPPTGPVGTSHPDAGAKDAASSD